jgi:SAM-dependent methyltransferase
MDSRERWRTAFGGIGEARLAVYDELMVPRVFVPWGNVLLDELALAPGEAVLDVACGPGSVTRIAGERVGPTGRVVGSDLSPAMLALARTKPAGVETAAIEYREAPADRLPVRDGEFDVVTCQHGLQFFPDRPAAVAEMRRALRPGGRAGIVVWTAIEHSPPFAALADGVEEVVGAAFGDRYRSGPFGLSEAEPRGLLQAAGFDEIVITPRTLPVTFEGGPAQIVATLGSTPLADAIQELPAERQEQLVAAVARRTGDGPVRSTMEGNIAVARR